MAGKTLVGSKLPYSIILVNPVKLEQKVTIRGLNAAPRGANGSLMVVPYMTTEVDSDFWTAWYTVHNHDRKPFEPLKSGALFVAKTNEDLKAIGRENEGRKTGLEAMPRKTKDIKAASEE
jgi:hypothetical protein